MAAVTDLNRLSKIYQSRQIIKIKNSLDTLVLLTSITSEK